MQTFLRSTCASTNGFLDIDSYVFYCYVVYYYEIMGSVGSHFCRPMTSYRIWCLQPRVVVSLNELRRNKFMN